MKTLKQNGNDIITVLVLIAGAYIGTVVGVFIIFMVSPVKEVAFLIFIAVLQQSEGNPIYPKAVGFSVGLPDIWVFAAVTVGGGIMCIPCMLPAVPMAAVLYQISREDIRKGNMSDNLGLGE